MCYVVDGIDLGSRFAGGLGFNNEMAWPDTPNDKKKARELRQLGKEARSRTNSDASIASTGSLSINTDIPDEFVLAHREFLEDPDSPVPNSKTALGNVLTSTHNIASTDGLPTPPS